MLVQLSPPWGLNINFGLGITNHSPFSFVPIGQDCCNYVLQPSGSPIVCPNKHRPSERQPTDAGPGFVPGLGHSLCRTKPVGLHAAVKLFDVKSLLASNSQVSRCKNQKWHRQKENAIFSLLASFLSSKKWSLARSRRLAEYRSPCLKSAIWLTRTAAALLYASCRWPIAKCSCYSSSTSLLVFCWLSLVRGRGCFNKMWCTQVIEARVNSFCTFSLTSQLKKVAINFWAKFKVVRTSLVCMTWLPLTTGRKNGVGWSK